MVKFTIDDLRDFASEKGGECLDEEYKGVKKVYRFKCVKGHSFGERWSEMRSKTDRDWCHQCAMQRLKEIHDAQEARTRVRRHTAFVAFKEAFSVKTIADACVTVDDEEPTNITDEDYSKMLQFLVDHGSLLSQQSHYPLPDTMLVRIAETDPQKEVKKRFFCLMALPWISTAWNAFDQPISAAEYMMNSTK